jgi:hypothetical protein
MSSVGSKLDANQVLKQAYDETDNRLRVDAHVTAAISTIEVDAADSSIRISDGTDTMLVNADGSINTNVAVDAAGGDNIAISDGTHTAGVTVAGELKVLSTGQATETTLTTIKTETATQYATRVDQATSTVMYVGKAAIGSLTSGAVWRVKKVDTTSGIVITWADGNSNFDNIWDNRAILTYT